MVMSWLPAGDDPATGAPLFDIVNRTSGFPGPTGKQDGNRRKTGAETGE
jgi:hypothetical protein